MSKFGITILPARKKNGLILLLLGSLFLFGALLFKAYASIVLKVPPGVISANTDQIDLPSRLLIPRFKVDLPINEARIIDQQWEISQNGASWLSGTGLPGQDGNIVIYGHNKRTILGPIRCLSKGDEIKVIDQQAREHVYLVTETKTVASNNVQILLPASEERLTLYTCTGFLDRERYVVIAKRTGK